MSNEEWVAAAVIAAIILAMLMLATPVGFQLDLSALS
jgi:hypothetical protein